MNNDFLDSMLHLLEEAIGNAKETEMNKIAAMPINDKNLKNIFSSRTTGLIALKLGM